MKSKIIESRFFSAYNRRSLGRSCCVGSPESPVFSDSFDDNGVPVVVVTGKTNLDDYIQSFKDDTDIYKILDRLSLSGVEPPVVPVDSFADITGLPDNIHEAYKQVQYARVVFNSLDADKRKEYNNNFNEFISDFGSDKFLSLFKFEPLPGQQELKVSEGGVSDVN